MSAGQTLQVQAPSGQMVAVVIPAGIGPGQTFIIQVPAVVAAANEDEYSLGSLIRPTFLKKGTLVILLVIA